MLRPGLKILGAALALIVTASALPAQEPVETAPVEAALARARTALEAGDLSSARGSAGEAYLAFERIEADLAARDHERAESLEARIEELGAALTAGDPDRARVAAAEADELLASLESGGRETPGWAAFVQSFGILFREGIEALLLCTALAAAAVKAGNRAGTRAIWQGALAALVVSLATAVLVERVLHLAPAGREAIEGLTMLLAAAVLFYVSYWLLSKLEVARWMAYLSSRVQNSQSRWALASVAFLAVYREGVETVLFYQALSAVAEPVPMWGGAVVAAVALAGVGAAVIKFGLRLPIRPLFAVTGSLLYFLAFVFTGQGLHELQEAGWIASTPVSGVPRIAWLGIYPTLETLAGQAVLLALALVAFAVWWRRKDAAPAPPARPAGERAGIR